MSPRPAPALGVSITGVAPSTHNDPQSETPSDAPTVTVDRARRWDRCRECRHFRADHDVAGCAVDIPRGGHDTACDCLDFLDPAGAPAP